jgi:hypothetical protein
VTCKHCQTEIADKALICFRCGQATSEPVAALAVGGRARRKSIWPAAIGLTVLAAAGLFMAKGPVGDVPDWLRWTIAGGAAVVLAYRVVRRMRR